MTTEDPQYTIERVVRQYALFDITTPTAQSTLEGLGIPRVGVEYALYRLASRMDDQAMAISRLKADLPIGGTPPPQAVPPPVAPLPEPQIAALMTPRFSQPRAEYIPNGVAFDVMDGGPGAPTQFHAGKDGAK